MPERGWKTLQYDRDVMFREMLVLSIEGKRAHVLTGRECERKQERERNENNIVAGNGASAALICINHLLHAHTPLIVESSRPYRLRSSVRLGVEIRMVVSGTCTHGVELRSNSRFVEMGWYLRSNDVKS